MTHDPPYCYLAGLQPARPVLLWLVSCWWNNLILGFPYVKGLGYRYGGRGQRECKGPDAARKERPSLSLAVLEEERVLLVAGW